MKMRCEIYVKYVLPGIRALVAEYLIKTYGLTQMKAAEKLGMTQAAISYYVKARRGKKVLDVLRSSSLVREHVKRLGDLAMKHGMSDELQNAFCEVCRAIQNDKNLVREILNKI
ncbi:MAG: transcriptional regulator [Candidatus Njordarchaeales archaeon]